jgi:hypothetical protein
MKYIHYRLISNGQPKSRGGVTIAYDVDGDHVYYAVARCSPKDNYNKRIGRAIATGRFDKHLGEGTIQSVPLVGKPAQCVIDHYANSL